MNESNYDQYKQLYKDAYTFYERMGFRGKMLDQMAREEAERLIGLYE